MSCCIVKYICCCCCSFDKSCLTLCDPMDCSTPGLPVPHYLPEIAQVHVHWIGGAIQPSHPVTLFSFCLQSFPAWGSFPISQFFTSGGQSIGASASAPVLPMNIQGWCPLGLICLMSIQSKGLSRVFSSTSLLQHHQFKSINSLAFCLTWLLERL